MTSKFQQAKTAAQIAAAIASTASTDIVEQANTNVTNTTKSSVQRERERQVPTSGKVQPTKPTTSEAAARASVNRPSFSKRRASTIGIG